MTRRIPEGVPILSAADMRAAEESVFASGTPQIDLMERAGLAVAQLAGRFAANEPVLVLAGPGNNGGDAYVAARHLSERGFDVMVAGWTEAKPGAAATMRARWSGPVVPLAEAKPRTLVIDGLFGTGLTRPLDPELRDLLHRLVGQARFSIAIDLPSGLGTDSAADLGAAPAKATVALGALKPAHVLVPGMVACGHVVLADLGIALPGRQRTVARPHIASPAMEAHKYRRGLVGVVGGAMPGAAALAARAAVRSGAGYVVLAGGHAGDNAIVSRPPLTPQTLTEWTEEGRIMSLLIGPGLGRDAKAAALLAAAVETRLPLVLDGDTLSLLGRSAADRLAGRSAPTLLTPHAGEFAAMFGVGAPTSKLEATLEAARRCAAIVVHKGPDTVIAAPDGEVRVAASQSSWLSCAGTGDVLAGLIAGRLAVDPASPLAAAEAAVWLHGRAASLAGPAFAADDLISRLAEAIAQCR